MEVNHNHNAKSQLAKLLATENITVQHKPDAKTAWFDVKNRVLSLPIWREMSNDLYDLLVVHEVGHALDTPAEGFIDAITAIANRAHNGAATQKVLGAVKGFLNVIEDARIDKRQKRRFPGARRNYVKGYQELIEKDFFGTLKRDVNTMSFIDRLNIYCKGGSMLGINFSAEEKSMLAKVEAAETFEEVLALTEEIYGWSKERQQNEAQSYKPEESEEADEDDGEWDWEQSDEDADDTSDDEASGSGNSPSDEDEDGDESEDDAESEPDGNADGEGSDDNDPLDLGTSKSPDDDIPESETEKAWQKNQEDLVVHSDEEYVYTTIPRPINYDNVVIDYKIVLDEQRKAIASLGTSWVETVRAELMRFKADENATISFMVKEFDMRKSADEYSRTSVSKTGVIDTNKLHSYKYNDDLFRRITTVSSGKNHGFVMFVDWSGSMQFNLKKTLKQLFSLVMFCNRVQIPFEVYSFRSTMWADYDSGRIKDNGVSFFTTNPKNLFFKNFFARNILSSRMKVQELNDAMLHLYAIACGGTLRCDDMASTPLNDCIGIADLIINRFRAKSKVQIVNTIFLTDGQSDPITGVCGFKPSYNKKQKYILQDEVTKKTYDIRNAAYNYGAPYASKNMTTLLLNVLKDRTGCNLIGFYICGEGFDSVYRDYSGAMFTKAHDTAKKSFTQEGFYGVTGAGYDEYYIINPKTFNTSSGNLNVSSDMTKRALTSEFIKFSEKKTVSRVLLTRFVKRIAA